MLPRIMPHTSTSVGAKNSLRIQHLPQRSIDAKRQVEYDNMLNGQVYGNLYQVAGSAGQPERGVKSQLQKAYNHHTFSPTKNLKQDSDGSPGNFQEQFSNMPQNQLGCEPPLDNEEGTGQMFSGGNPVDQPIEAKIDANQYSISLKEGGSQQQPVANIQEEPYAVSLPIQISQNKKSGVPSPATGSNMKTGSVNSSIQGKKPPLVTKTQQ